MKEKVKVERDVMGLEEFKEHVVNNISNSDNQKRRNNLITFEAVTKYKSVNRAINRGHVMENGMIIPKRPFNNRANSCKRKDVHSRSTNELKKEIYGYYRQYQRNIA